MINKDNIGIMDIGTWSKVHGQRYMDIGICTWVYGQVPCNVVLYIVLNVLRCTAFALRFHASGFCSWWLLWTRVSLFF